MYGSMPGFSVHHQLLELSQTHPSSWWCHPTIWSSVIPFSFCFQSFPASGSFQMSQFFFNQVAKVLKLQLQHQSFQWIFRTDLDLPAWFPCSPRNSQESYPTPQFKSINFWALSFLYVQPSHPYMTIERIIALTRWTFVSKVLSLLFNMLSRFVTVFHQRSIF